MSINTLNCSWNVKI